MEIVSRVTDRLVWGCVSVVYVCYGVISGNNLTALKRQQYNNVEILNKFLPCFKLNKKCSKKSYLLGVTSDDW